ncbi:signal transduction histidine kinase [Methanosalsum zhilinae DSM 4017]|uniref:Signal transduction histidine kinase n=1 Tax=Methanosalsum zhilinae (strain DSM 4017 / NBRC 107636 / OCM 62 / WeN5) TaxID=679901 RepID=F7XPE3_METZD|nr:histidine kinase dimerization/phosphoacceptor domain -containing protein [Methanosalsum zhilinae]AEH60271.1 signal transduction histidine kinase [Methanosalsum zhilinae DSM 4017]
MHSNNFNKNVLDTLGLNVVLLDPDGMVVSYNKQWEKFAKNNNNPSLKNSDIGSNYLEVTKKAMLEGDKFAEKAFDGIMSIIKGQCNEFDLEYPCHSPNEKRWFIMHARKCIGQDLVVIYHENITDRKIAEEKLKASEEKYKKLAESTDAILWEYDLLQDRWTYVAPQVTDILGYPPEKWNDMQFWMDRIHPEDKENAVKYFSECMECGTARRFEYRFFRKDNSIAWIRDVLNVDTINKVPVKLRGFMIDITEHKHLEELKKKELLLKEIHHRVKNNLQVIASLLNMQSRNFDDDKIKDAFRDSQNRIRSMSLAHEKLYGSEKLANIELSDYIKSLENFIVQTHDTYKTKIYLINDLDTAYLDIDKTIPLGLILTELMTNSFKHAFPNRSEGTISIKFKTLDDGYLLNISDDGIGISDEFDVETSKSLGLKIVNMLVQQLHASIEMTNSNGTDYVIRF